MCPAAVVILDGDRRGDEVAFGQRLRVGRHTENDLRLAGSSVSRHHLEIESREDGYWLTDRDSTSGTHVNGKRVKQQRLQHGDRLLVGEVELIFRVVRETPPFVDVPTSPGRRVDSRGGAATTAEISLDQPDALLQITGELDPKAELRKLIRFYSVLHGANKLISSEAGTKDTYQSVLELLFAAVPASRGVIMIRDPASGHTLQVAQLSREPGERADRVRVSQTIVARALERRLALLTNDAMRDFQAIDEDSIFVERICSAICVPLISADEVLGVIYLDSQSTDRPLDPDMLRLVAAIAGPAAIAIQNTSVIDQLRQKSEELHDAYLATISVITNAIEARDRSTVGHAWRVTRFSLALASALGWSEDRLSSLEVGALLHDVGKVGIVDAVLNKNGSLSPEELSVMRRHPEIGAHILKDVPFLEPMIAFVLHHHERWDGNGYPAGLSGEQIPPEGRLLAIADAFDAMTSNRVYHPCMARDDALAELERCSGSQFDPRMMDPFIELARRGDVDKVLQTRALTQPRNVECPTCTTIVGLEDGGETGEELRCPVCKTLLG